MVRLARFPALTLTIRNSCWLLFPQYPLLPTIAPNEAPPAVQDSAEAVQAVEAVEASGAGLVGCVGDEEVAAGSTAIATILFAMLHLLLAWPLVRREWMLSMMQQRATTKR
jgi:hypothetical protein